MSDVSAGFGAYGGGSDADTISTAAWPLAVIGAILLVTSFMVQQSGSADRPRRRSCCSSPSASRSRSGYLKVKSQQDFYGGMALILLSLIAFVASNDLPGMRGFAFGPGTAPRLFAFALALLSLGVVVRACSPPGPDVTHTRSAA